MDDWKRAFELAKTIVNDHVNDIPKEIKDKNKLINGVEVNHKKIISILLLILECVEKEFINRIEVSDNKKSIFLYYIVKEIFDRKREKIGRLVSIIVL